jgi:Asp-tRNA(Asn)/Glu-tRNA(Gln) amidotransferase A subunit family amidase
MQGAEAFGLHRPWLEEFADRYDPVVLARIRRGGSWTEADRSDAARIAAEVRNRFAALFARYDVLLLPAVDGPAPRRPVPAETRERLLRLNAPPSLAGLPVLTVPASGGEEGSLGLQCILPPDRWRAVLEGVFDSAEEGRG